VSPATCSAIISKINCNDHSSVAGVWLFKLKFLMLGALTSSQLLMLVVLTLLAYQYLCLWHVWTLSFELEKEAGGEERKKESQGNFCK